MPAGAALPAGRRVNPGRWQAGYRGVPAIGPLFLLPAAAVSPMPPGQAWPAGIAESWANVCTIVRLDLALSATAPPVLTSSTVIGTHFPWRANKTALVLAPTGLALGRSGTLYVDDTQTSFISAIPQARTRTSAVTRVRRHHLLGRSAQWPARHDAGPQRRSDCRQRQQRQCRRDWHRRPAACHENAGEKRRR